MIESVYFCPGIGAVNQPFESTQFCHHPPELEADGCWMIRRATNGAPAGAMKKFAAVSKPPATVPFTALHGPRIDNKCICAHVTGVHALPLPSSQPSAAITARRALRIMVKSRLK